MKRKVIQVGNSTQLISLPRKWCKKHGLMKGDELDVVIQGSKLEVNAGSTIVENRAIIDVTGLDRTSVLYCIRSAYRRGYDVITIRFSSSTAPHFRSGKEKAVLAVINEEVNNLVGMEVIEQKEDICTLKDISNESFEDFDIMLKRVFLLFKDASNDLIVGADKHDRIALETIDEKHDRITIFISYCLRMLNRKGYNEQYKNSLLYLIIGNLDKITDVLKYAARDLLQYDKRVSNETLKVLTETLSIMKVYYGFFYKFDVRRVKDMYVLRHKMIQKINKLTTKVPLEEIMILNNVRQICELVVSITEAKLSLEL